MKFLPLVAVLALTFCSGCGILLPKDIELFQKKVKPMPTLGESGENRQRQAADFIARQEPTNRLANSLSASLGPPYRPYTGNPDRLADRLDHDRADLNEDLADYSASVDKLVGKKIEGTGLFRVNYFVGIGGIFLVLFILWSALKVYGIANPVVGTATGIIGRISSTVLHNVATETVMGGEQFLHWVNSTASPLTQDLKDWVTESFKVAHQTQQSPATQAVVDKLTASNLSTQSNPIPPPQK